MYVDNCLEEYHVPHIDPEWNRILDYRNYVVEPARWYPLQHSPLASDDARYGTGETLYRYLCPTRR